MRPSLLCELRIHQHFYPRTSCEVRLTILNDSGFTKIFLLTHLLRGATMILLFFHPRKPYFYSRTSCEVRRYNLRGLWTRCDFYSRTSCEVRHSVSYTVSVFTKFLLTHLLRGATFVRAARIFAEIFLLTHLLRGATSFYRQELPLSPFLLTHLLRGATFFFVVYIITR